MEQITAILPVVTQIANTNEHSAVLYVFYVIDFMACMNYTLYTDKCTFLSNNCLVRFMKNINI